MRCGMDYPLQCKVPIKWYVWQSFWHLTCKNLHKNKLHVTWQAQFRFWHVVWHGKKKTTRQFDTSKIEMSCITRHVTLRWHFRRRCRCQLTLVFVSENDTWHFGLEVERQMKFVKHTNWSPYIGIYMGLVSPSTPRCLRGPICALTCTKMCIWATYFHNQFIASRTTLLKINSFINLSF